MAKTRKHYDELMETKIARFSPKDVDLRSSKGKLKCGNCIHFLVRKVDDLGVCEIVESPTGGIDENDCCDFWTRQGSEFPLLK